MSKADSSAWATQLAEHFNNQASLTSTRDNLEQEQKRAAAAEAELHAVRQSRWWRLSAPLREPLERRRETKRQRSKAREHDEILGAVVGKALPATAEAGLATALARRVSVVVAEFSNEEAAEKELDLARLLDHLKGVIEAHDHDTPLLWLTHIALTGRYPTSPQLIDFVSAIESEGIGEAIAHLLAESLSRPNSWVAHADLELVRDVIIDPTTTSRRPSHTGIPRVVRECVPRWQSTRGAKLMVWSQAGSYRPPSPIEAWRVRDFVANTEPNLQDRDQFDRVIQVPWRTTVVVPEPATQLDRSTALECMGTHSGNTVGIIFHDLLMFVMPDNFTVELRAMLGNSIPAIRGARRVSTVSGAVRDDLRAFVSGFGNAGYQPPEVEASPNPITARAIDRDVVAANRRHLEGVPGLPLVLSVGSIEPRKNQLVLLRAAELLWREGLAFQLLFIGWNSWDGRDFEVAAERARSRGRPVRIIRRASEDLLWSAYQIATFSVYISLAEGYGLPVAESLAAGTPVITTNYGSQSEIAAAGGARTVDPRSASAVAAAMRALLTDDGELTRLRQEAATVDLSSWDAYADTVWKWLAEGVPPNSA